MRKVKTNRRNRIFGLFAMFAMAIGVGVSLAPKEVLKTEAASWTEATSITSGDKYLITVNSYYLPTAEAAGGPPAAISFTNVANISETQAWKFTASGEGWVITHDFGGAKDIELYNTNANNGVKYRVIGTTTQAWTAVYSNGSFKITGSNSRDLALYNNQDWRSYSSASGTKTIKLYKLNEDAATVTSLQVTTQPTKKTYLEYDEFDPTGMVVKANYSDGTSQNIAHGDLVITPSTMSLGVTSVTISFGGKSTTVSGIVVNPNPIQIDAFSVKGFGGYTGGYDSNDHIGEVGDHETKLALRVYNGGNGQVRGNQSGIANNFSARNTTAYPGYIRKIVLKGTGGTFTASESRSLVNVGTLPFSLDDASVGTKVQGVYTTEGANHILTWEIPEEVDARFFMLHNLQAGGTMLAAAADAFQIFYEPAEETFGTLDHIELNTDSNDLKLNYFIGEKLSTFGLLVFAYDGEGPNANELIISEYTTDPVENHPFSTVGKVSVTVYVTIDGVTKDASYDVQVMTTRTFTKVSTQGGIRYGQSYVIASELGAAGDGFTTFAAEVGIDYNETSHTINEVSNLQTMTLELGSAIGSYAIKLTSGPGIGKYYAWKSDNTLALEDEVSDVSSWFITFDEGDEFRIKNVGDETRFIAHNHTSARFAAYTSVPSGGAAPNLFIDSGNLNAVAEAQIFVNEVNSGVGEGAKGACHDAYSALKVIYDRLSGDAKTALRGSAEADFIKAVERYDYLEAWTAANPEPGAPGSVISPNNENAPLNATLIIGLLGLTTIAGYYFLSKKEKLVK